MQTLSTNKGKLFFEGIIKANSRKLKVLKPFTIDYYISDDKYFSEDNTFDMFYEYGLSLKELEYRIIDVMIDFYTVELNKKDKNLTQKAIDFRHKYLDTFEIIKEEGRKING